MCVEMAVYVSVCLSNTRYVQVTDGKAGKKNGAGGTEKLLSLFENIKISSDGYYRVTSESIKSESKVTIVTCYQREHFNIILTPRYIL
jgi:hypothetical protein